jgi:hypothetical protein
MFLLVNVESAHHDQKTGAETVLNPEHIVSPEGRSAYCGRPFAGDPCINAAASVRPRLFIVLYAHNHD